MDPPEEEKNKEEDRNKEELNITPEEMKLMRKKVLRYDKIKAEFDKMKTNYDSLLGEYKKLKQEYDAMNQQNVEIEKRTNEEKRKQDEQRRKQEQSVESMQQTIKQLQLIVDLTTKSEGKLKREDERLRQCLRIQKQLGGKLKEELEALRSGAADIFNLKQEMNRLTLQNKSLKQAKEKYPLIMQKCDQQDSVIASLKTTILAHEQQTKQFKGICTGLQKRVNTLLQEKRQADRKVQKERAEKEQLLLRVDAAENALVDERTQMDLQRKKYQNDIRTLKTQLHNEHEQLRITQLQLKPTTTKKVKWIDLSKDDLFNHIEELEMKNSSLQINLMALAESSHNRELKIKQQGETIMALTSHILKAHPSLQESEQLQFIEKQIKEQLKRKQWAEVVEKVMIENFRLKEAVTALGKEYNASLRGDMKGL